MGIAIVDGRVMQADEAMISIEDDGLWRGDGAFEVVRVYAGRPWALNEHLDRMAVSARALRLPFSAPALAADIATLLQHVPDADALLRLAVTRGGRRIGMLEDISPSPPSVALVTMELTPSGLLAGIKSLSYAANMLATRLAKERGADDALFVASNQRVLETPSASFFYVRETGLFTPPLDDLVLKSITRSHVLELTNGRERVTTRADLSTLSEAFIASTGREVVPVRSIDGVELPLAPGPVTISTAALLRHRIASLLARPDLTTTA